MAKRRKLNRRQNKKSASLSQRRAPRLRRIGVLEQLEERQVLTCLLPDSPVTFNDPLAAAEVNFYELTLCSALDLDDGDTLVIETLGSNLTPANDTELGLYNDVGDVLAVNDDIEFGNLLSLMNLPADLTTGQTTLPTLMSGDYTIAAGAYNTTFQSGLDGMGNPNATSSSTYSGPLQVNVTLSQNNFGTLVSGAPVTDTDPLVAEEVKFFRFELAADVTAGNGNSLVIDTLGSMLTDAGYGPNDTELGLFTITGNLVANNDDFGGDRTSQLSFGVGGADGELTAGTYFLAAGAFDTTFGDVDTTTSTSVATGDIQVNLNLTGLDPLVVTTVNDVVDAGDGETSLREAMNFAHSNPGVDTITFDPGLSGQTVNVTNGPLPEIFESLTVRGLGSNALTVSGDGTSRLFGTDLSSNEEFNIEDITLTGGSTTVHGGAVFSIESGTINVRNSTLSGNSAGDRGGAIYSYFGSVNIDNSTLFGNSAGYGGGAIYSVNGNLTIANSVVNNNEVGGSSSSADSHGGGIFASAGNVMLIDSTVSGNVTSGGDSNTNGGVASGGGIRAEGDLVLINSSVSGNVARGGAGSSDAYYSGGSSTGGGIRTTAGNLTLIDSTVSNNSSSGGTGGTGGSTSGGGIRGDSGSITLINSTVSGNSANGGLGDVVNGLGLGGGLFTNSGSIALQNSTVVENEATPLNYSYGGGIRTGSASVDMSNSVVANNNAERGPDILGTVTANFSLIEDVADVTITGANNIQGQDPQLGPLANNGGLTLTHLPSSGSPAINAGDPAAMVGDGVTPDLDQRGENRVFDNRLDIGAVEVQTVTILACDFGGDGFCDAADINALQANIVTGPADPATYDLTDDGLVTTADRDLWLALAGAENLASGNPYLLGDANLDGTVDGADFQAWSSNKFTSTSNWTDGDFNSDGSVDGHDFLAWNSNKFTSSDAEFGLLLKN